MKRIYFLYRTTNLLNNKRYYGKHSTVDINDRLKSTNFNNYMYI